MGLYLLPHCLYLILLLSPHHATSYKQQILLGCHVAALWEELLLHSRRREGGISARGTSGRMPRLSYISQAGAIPRRYLPVLPRLTCHTTTTAILHHLRTARRAPSRLRAAAYPTRLRISHLLVASPLLYPCRRPACTLPPLPHYYLPAPLPSACHRRYPHITVGYRAVLRCSPHTGSRSFPVCYPLLAPCSTLHDSACPAAALPVSSGGGGHFRYSVCCVYSVN